MTWHAFLSYSRQQYYTAELLALQLQQRGLSIWFDVQQLEPGADWQQDIQTGLEQSGAVLLLASRAALDSPYVEREWKHALSAGRPVLVALTERVKLPPDLRQAPVIDLRGNFEIAVEQVQRAIVSPTTPLPPIWSLPRFSSGVIRATCALVLRDLHAFSIILLAAIMWMLLVLQASLPRFAIERALAFFSGTTPAFNTYVPLLLMVGFLVLIVTLLIAILDMRTFRFLRHDLKTTVLAPLPPRSRLWLPVVMWLALASGHIPAVLEYYTPLDLFPVAPPLLITLGVVIVVVGLLRWVYQWVMPQLPDADLLRWSRPGEAPDHWRAQLSGGWGNRAIEAGIQPSLPPLASVTPRTGLRMRAVVAPADRHILEAMRPIILEIGGELTPLAASADYDLLILSHASSRQQVATALEGSERMLGIIASRFTLPHELEALGKMQLVDYSRQDRNNLRAALRLLIAQTDADLMRLQAYLEPVNLAQVAPSRVVQQIASSLLSLLLLSLLLLGISLWQRDSLAEETLPTLALPGTLLLLLVANVYVRRGRLPMPHWGMLVLVLLPLVLMTVIVLSLPPQLSLGESELPINPYGWRLLIGTTGITSARSIWLLVRNPYVLGIKDEFGMPSMGLNLRSSLVWLAGCFALFGLTNASGN